MWLKQAAVNKHGDKVLQTHTHTHTHHVYISKQCLILSKEKFVRLYLDIFAVKRHTIICHQLPHPAKALSCCAESLWSCGLRWHRSRHYVGLSQSKQPRQKNIKQTMTVKLNKYISAFIADLWHMGPVISNVHGGLYEITPFTQTPLSWSVKIN